MAKIFRIGEKVIVNTGGKDTRGTVVRKLVLKTSTGKQETLPVIKFSNKTTQAIPTKYIKRSA